MIVWFVRALIILVGIIAVLWLGMLNADQRVDFQFFGSEYPGLNLNLLMLLVFVTGMVFSFLIAAINELQLRRQLGRHRRDLGRAEREMSALRSLPLDDAEPVRSDTDTN
jgi:putative membrane protein